MNQPPNSGMNTPPGYGQTPPGYGPPPQSGPVPNSGSYQPPPQGRTGFTRQIFNPAMYRQPGSGSWAAASLILAIIGWVTLGCLGWLTWPLGLLFGLIGLVGTKRAKGMSFAGVILSGAGIACFIAFFALGFYVQFQGDTMAEQGGKPVVAAIEDFKKDHKRVPNTLDELITEGYLPATWTQGFEGIDSHVEDVVTGKRWDEFLAYKPGENATWVGKPGQNKKSLNVEGDFGDWSISLDGNEEGKTYQTYGLSFIGIDGISGTSDDKAVNQAPEEPYDLANLWSDDNNTRELSRKRRDLQRVATQLADKKDTLGGAVQKAEADLAQVEGEVRDLMRAKDLASFDEVKKDNKGAGLLKLAGATAKRLSVAQKKLQLVTAKIDDISIQVRLLENEEEMSKLADSPKEMAELVLLLEESQKVLDDKVSLGDLDTKADDVAADEWFKDRFK
ncbi:MAG: hypothetical protein KDB90_07100 [Planctomycetes bacterium]|nr:hypothetical protein [Planctomycetota bacterium]